MDVLFIFADSWLRDAATLGLDCCVVDIESTDISVLISVLLSITLLEVRETIDVANAGGGPAMPYLSERQLVSPF